MPQHRVILGKYHVFLGVIDMTLGATDIIKGCCLRSRRAISAKDEKAPITGLVGKPLVIFHHHRNRGKFTLKITFTTDRLGLADAQKIHRGAVKG